VDIISEIMVVNMRVDFLDQATMSEIILRF